MISISLSRCEFRKTVAPRSRCGTNNIAHETAPHRIEPRRRLIEENQVGLVNQRLGQADALEHALGKTL